MRKNLAVVTADCKCTFDLQPESDYEICASKESAKANGDYDKPCKQITTKGKTAPVSLEENLEFDVFRRRNGYQVREYLLRLR